MFFALIFVCNRILQMVTLIPTMGMLAWFVNRYTKENALTPSTILVLFIVSILALAWAFFTLFSYHRSSANAHFVALVDIAMVGALIAGVYYLRGIAGVDCTTISSSSDWTVHLGDVVVSGPGLNWHTSKPCAMLKASFAFGIMNCIFFFITAISAYWHGGRMGAYDDSRDRDRNHSSRHSHRHRSHSDSRRSSHSHRRVYV